jgi:hypothetical protein
MLFYVVKWFSRCSVAPGFEQKVTVATVTVMKPTARYRADQVLGNDAWAVFYKVVDVSNRIVNDKPF